MSHSSRSGFTLIELLLGVTLSAILMTGIVVFVSNSLGSNIATKKALEDGNQNGDFEQRLTEVLGNITGSGIYATGSSFGGGYLTGIFLATGGPNLPITYLGLKTQTGYCDSASGTASETGTVMRLALRQFAVPTIENAPLDYTLPSSGNAVFSGTTRVVGTGYPGNVLTNSGIDTELSSPSALMSSGTHLYIADTMNNRVLSYDMTSGGITKLLGQENGISKPTSLYFSWSSLLIASSGNGKIYSLQDGDWDGSMFSSNFRIANNFSADTVRFTFSGIPDIDAPTGSGSFSFTGFTQNPSDTVSTWSSLMYSGTLRAFTTGTSYGIAVKNISPPPTTPGNYTVQSDFQSGGVTQYSDIFHYFTKWDGSLKSSTGNILTVVSEGLIYPHGITGPNTWSGTIDWNAVLWGNPPGDEVLSYLPVQDFSYQISGKILTIRYHEYTKYDCILGKHSVEEKVRKVFLP